MMNQETSKREIRIAYIGGGSGGWAWSLMSDLALTEELSGIVRLYDIDRQAAQHNEMIGNSLNEYPESRSHWKYEAVQDLRTALQGAHFVVISILPGTFDAMWSDVHTPEEYGIYQSVGDTTGPGGLVSPTRSRRALRPPQEFLMIDACDRVYSQKRNLY